MGVTPQEGYGETEIGEQWRWAAERNSPQERPWRNRPGSARPGCEDLEEPDHPVRERMGFYGFRRTVDNGQGWLRESWGAESLEVRGRSIGRTLRAGLVDRWGGQGSMGNEDVEGVKERYQEVGGSERD